MPQSAVDDVDEDARSAMDRAMQVLARASKSVSASNGVERLFSEEAGREDLPASAVAHRVRNYGHRQHPAARDWFEKDTRISRHFTRPSGFRLNMVETFGIITSGKVPTSYPRSEDDTLYAGRPERYPGLHEGDGYPVVRYSEGWQIGHRLVPEPGNRTAGCFGFGLSYVTFEITDVSLVTPDAPNAALTVTATVRNTGTVAEVVRVYLGIPVDRQPPKRLVRFRKVFL